LSQGAVSSQYFQSQLKGYKESCRFVNFYYYCKSPLEYKCPVFKKKKYKTKFVFLLTAEESPAILTLHVHKADNKLKNKSNTVKYLHDLKKKKNLLLLKV